MKAKNKYHVLIKKLQDTLFLILLRAFKLSFFLLCFSASLNTPSNSKSGIELFSAAFAEETAVSKEQAAKAVWEIHIKDSFGGSGFFIEANKIITNYHVISDIESVGLENIKLVQKGNPKQLKIKRISALSIIYDFALLEVDGAVSNFLNLPPTASLSSTKNLYVLGYPGGKFKEIKQIKNGVQEDSFFVDYDPLHGASGSPILNEFHQLVGIQNAASANLLSFISLRKLKHLGSENFLCKGLNVKECFRSSIRRFEQSTQEAREARDYYEIGLGYLNNKRLFENNLSKAKKWMKKAADQDYVPAQYNLARIYMNLSPEYFDLGMNLSPEDFNLGMNLSPEDSNLGIKLSPEYFELGVELMHQAAKKNYPPAQAELGNILYRAGQDNSKSKELFKKAVQQGYSLGTNNLYEIIIAESGIDIDSSSPGNVVISSDRGGKKNLIQTSTKCLSTFLK